MTIYVPSKQDRFNEQRSLGISSMVFKLAAVDNSDLFIIENIFHAPGGPARHLHYDQDEWFFVVEGQFIAEVGDDRFTLNAGDSLFAPRKIPHVWACITKTGGRILIVFSPAGSMEAFFSEVTKTHAMPAQDAALWHQHGMELLGPPLTAE